MPFLHSWLRRGSRIPGCPSPGTRQIAAERVCAPCIPRRQTRGDRRRRLVQSPFAGRWVPVTRAIPMLESRGGCLSLARALLNERLSLFEGGREVRLHQEGFGEGFSFPAAQDTHLPGSPVENNLHDWPLTLGWPIGFPSVQCLRAGERINRGFLPGLMQQRRFARVRTTSCPRDV